MWWLFSILIAIAVQVIVYLLTPKPKGPTPQAVTDMEGPTAEAGRPIPVIFGTVTIKGVNIIWYGDKSYSTFMVDV